MEEIQINHQNQLQTIKNEQNCLLKSIKETEVKILLSKKANLYLLINLR